MYVFIKITAAVLQKRLTVKTGGRRLHASTVFVSHLGLRAGWRGRWSPCRARYAQTLVCGVCMLFFTNFFCGCVAMPCVWASRRLVRRPTLVSSQDHQLGAAEIQDVNVFTHLLSASPWMLWFLNPADESGFVDHMWNNVWRRQVVATSVGLALIVAVLALAVTPPSVYDDVVTLLCFILGQLIPMTVVLVWTFTPTRFQTSCVFAAHVSFRVWCIYLCSCPCPGCGLRWHHAASAL